MGGNALKKVKTSRIDVLKYNEIKVDLKNKFENKLKTEYIIEMPNKIDFGDVDILYLNNDLSKNGIIQLVNELFNSVEIVINGPVCSFAYEIEASNTNEKKYFQIDLIGCNNIEMSRFYFSYGDLGGIIGRMTQHIGLSFGSDGLYVHPQEETIKKYLLKYSEKFDNNDELDNKKNSEIITNVQYKNIKLTLNPEEICIFLDLEYSKWLDGFDTQENIFKWIQKSKYCKKDSFRALDYTHRQRASKRPMYQNFLKFIFNDEKEFNIEKGNSNKYINHNEQLRTIEYFGKIDELETDIKEQMKRLKRKEKFSGNKFIKIGIKEKEIKTYMDNFKFYIIKQQKLDFNDWLDITNKEDIDIEINRFFLQNS